MPMSKRIDSIVSTVLPELEAKEKQTLERLRKEFDAKRDEIVASFNVAFVDGLKKVADAQPQKGKIKRIHISYLLASLIAGQCEFRIDFYNHERYVDNVATEVYWVADFVSACFKDDFEHFTSLLKEKLIRVMDYEVQTVVVDFGVFYLAMLTFHWLELFKELPFKKYEHLFEEQIEVVYGGFQDKSLTIMIINMGEI